jgi:pimeloyl-ACP methyl ester carboxylesterase
VIRAPIAVVLGLAALWLALRVALVASGGELGHAIDIDIGGHRSAALLFRGASPAHTLVVSSHGGLASKESMLSVCWEARRRGADCILVDALGHGASGAIPSRDALGALHRGLRVEGAIGSYSDVRYVGHSMGAALGCGAVYPCARSVSIGQGVACDESRIVYGSVHRDLGLPEVFYLPVSHLLEPWTPSVIDRAMSRLLPEASSDRAAIETKVVLAWSSFAVMMAIGVLAAKRARAVTSLGPLARGLAAGAVIWAALALGAWRTLWFLVPTQVGDVAMIAAVLVPSLGAALLLRTVGLRSSLVGATMACVVSEMVAILTFALVRVPVIGQLLVLMPLLCMPLAVVIVSWERLSRCTRSDVVEGAAMASALGAAFLALLLPAT